MLDIKEWTCYRGGKPVFAPLTLQLPSSQALLVRGNNGSGKTTLLRSLSGLFADYRGALSWQGEQYHPHQLVEKRIIFLAGHKEPMKAHLTVGENLHFWASIMDRSNKISARAHEDALQLFSIGDYRNRPFGQLSAGQKKRAALSLLAFCQQPLWLLDEPTTHLDEASITQLNRLINSHREKGGAVLIATHDPSAFPNLAEVCLEPSMEVANGQDELSS